MKVEILNKFLINHLNNACSKFSAWPRCDELTWDEKGKFIALKMNPLRLSGECAWGREENFDDINFIRVNMREFN